MVHILKTGIISSILMILLSLAFTGDTGTDNIKDIKDPDLKFMLIGDPHVKAEDNDTGTVRFRSIVNFINNMDIDFVVIMGDITDKGTKKQYDLTKEILKDLNKPYYVVKGNHDIMTSDHIFDQYYGPSERIEYKKQNNIVYQLLFIGTYGDRKNLTDIHWSFDFNKANKTIPTIIFSHSPIRCPSSVYISCKLDEDVLVYGKSMANELDEFTNLLGVFSGHIHRDSDEQVNGVRYVTINGLVYMGIAGILAQPSDNIGYSVIKDGKLYFQFISYAKVKNDSVI